MSLCLRFGRVSTSVFCGKGFTVAKLGAESAGHRDREDRERVEDVMMRNGIGGCGARYYGGWWVVGALRRSEEVGWEGKA